MTKKYPTPCPRTSTVCFWMVLVGACSVEGNATTPTEIEGSPVGWEVTWKGVAAILSECGLCFGWFVSIKWYSSMLNVTNWRGAELYRNNISAVHGCRVWNGIVIVHSFFFFFYATESRPISTNKFDNGCYSRRTRYVHETWTSDGTRRTRFF